MLAAYYAFEDVKMLHSNKDKLHLYERTRALAPGNAAPSEHPWALPALWVVLLSLSQCWLGLL